MVYNEKTKRVIMVMLLTSIPLDVIAINQDGYGPSEEDDNVYQTVQEEMQKAEEKMRAEFSKRGIDSVVVSGYTYEDEFDSGKGVLEYTVYSGDIQLARQQTHYDAKAYSNGDRSSYDSALLTLNDRIMNEALESLAELKVPLTDSQIIKLVETLVNNTNAGRENGLKYEVISSENGIIKVRIYSSTGETVYIDLTTDMTKEDATNAIQTEIQKLISTLNEELKDLSGNEYMADLFGEWVMPNQMPAVEGAGGRILAWKTVGMTKQWLTKYTVPGVKDKNGEPIVMSVYGAPFGKAGDGTHRFLGYSPSGDPLTNPFFRNDEEKNVKFWGREKFKEPWDNPKLKTIMSTSRYKVDLNVMPDIDGNNELNPLIWMGLQEYWSGYINDPAEEKNDWINHVKFQIPPTDDTWGLAYFPSKIGSGFWYATIPIPPKSYIGIDIQTITIVPTPQIATGRDIELKTVYNINDVPKNDKDYRVVISARRGSTPIAILNANRGINHSLFNLS